MTKSEGQEWMRMEEKTKIPNKRTSSGGKQKVMVTWSREKK
jgi:hypothetical protein